MATTTNSESNDNLLMSYFERKALVTLMDQVAFYQITDKKPLPKGSGKSITFNGWRKIAAASGTLSEYSASANVAVALSSRKVTATIASYGRAVQYSDTLELTSILPVDPGALAMLEQSAAETVDNIVQSAALKLLYVHTGNSVRCTSSILSGRMSSRASAFCADTGTSTIALKWGFPVVFGCSCTLLSATHKASAAVASISGNLGPIAINKVVTRLRRLGVKPMANGKYVGIAHPNALGSMMRNPDWKNWHVNFAGGPQESMYKHSTGVVHNVELIESANMPRWEGSLIDNLGKNLNITLIVGQGALSMTELDGGIKFIHHKGPQTADVFELYSTLAYKVRAAAAVTNPSCGVILITQDLVAPITTVA